MFCFLYNKYIRLFILLIISLTITIACGSLNSGGGKIKIGVMLTLSGSGDFGAKIPLEWAKENINQAGGINGKELELVYKDLAVYDPEDAANELLSDDNIKAVIGADTSSKTFDLAPMFIRKKKVLITPSATSAEITRAFGGKDYVWRTVESDIGQVRTMLVKVADMGYNKVALISGDDVYGGTFFDWFGFFATELGMEITNVIRYNHVEESCNQYLSEALESEPQVILVAPSTPETAVCIVKQHKLSGSESRLFFSDGATFSYITDELGEDAEGMQGLTVASDAQSGFDIAYKVHFEKMPGPFAANVYDALTLLAYGLQHCKGESGPELVAAMKEIVDAKGEEFGWDKQGVRQNLEAIASGSLPNIRGASGDMIYDSKLYMEPVSSTYAMWRVEGGEFVAVEYISSDDSENPRAKSGTSLFNTIASEAAKQNFGEDISGYTPAQKEGLWAMVMATSQGWTNYRHQSDALAVYQLLKTNGLKDDRIIFIMADDLAENIKNPLKGQIRNEPGGENLYSEITIDYNLNEIAPEDIFSILKGEFSDSLPEVINSTETDNIYLFIVGHGNDEGVYLKDQKLDPTAFNDTLAEMYANKRYRQVFIEIEACHSGTMGQALDTPGVVLYAASNPYENSFGANYDTEIRAWLADQFAYNFFNLAKTEPQITLRSLYEKLYIRVNGSHVSVYNAGRFGNVNETTLDEFIYP